MKLGMSPDFLMFFSRHCAILQIFIFYMPIFLPFVLMGIFTRVFLILVQKLTLRINEVYESPLYATFQCKLVGVSVQGSLYILKRILTIIILSLRGFTSFRIIESFLKLKNKQKIYIINFQ